MWAFAGVIGTELGIGRRDSEDRNIFGRANSEEITKEGKRQANANGIMIIMRDMNRIRRQSDPNDRSLKSCQGNCWTESFQE